MLSEDRKGNFRVGCAAYTAEICCRQHSNKKEAGQPACTGRRARDSAETRAVAADAELKQLKQELGKELQQAKDDLIERLEQAQATAEQRVDQHTEDYRLQVHTRVTALYERHIAMLALHGFQCFRGTSGFSRGAGASSGCC